MCAHTVKLGKFYSEGLFTASAWVLIWAQDSTYVQITTQPNVSYSQSEFHIIEGYSLCTSLNICGMAEVKYI